MKSVVVMMVLFITAPIKAVEISLSCSAVGKELQLCQQGVDLWQQKTGHKVKMINTPNDSTERLNLYKTLMAAKSDQIDVVGIDVVWPGLLATHLLDLTPYIDATEEKAFFSNLWQSQIVDGRLVAIPWFTDAGLLYYRKDLLKKYGFAVPTTWDQLTHQATVIQKKQRQAGHKRFWGYSFQAKAYEGLTCNALEWIYSHGGGTIVDTTGKVSVNNAAAKKAINMAAGWVGNISPKSVLNYTEEESRALFQTGNAVFLRNWPYVWNLAQTHDSPIKGKVGVAPLPRANAKQANAATLGGWGLAVSKYSKHPAVAADLVKFLSSHEEQKRRAITGGYHPTRTALYADMEILRQFPLMASLKPIFLQGVARPSGVTLRHYSKVSHFFYNAVHQVLQGQMSAEKALPKLAAKLRRLESKWH